MSSSIPTTTAERRRRVFLAARAIFTGQKAFIRDRNTVEKFISRHEWSFRKELLYLDKQPVIDITLSLLRKQVFESDEKAKLVFPELYHVSALRGLQHDTSERNAARSEAKAQEEVSRSEDVLYEADDIYEQGHLGGTPIASSSTLFPAYLSYAVQHKLLNAVQKLLEECCYDFARSWVPSVLEERNWDCAEAVEISRWSEVLPSKFAYIDTDATSLSSRDVLLDALKAISPLRHAAVHRLPTSAKGVEQMLNQALHLVQVLHDDSRTSKMEAILEDFRARREDMEIHKTNLENQLDQQLQHIQEQRAALDRKEQEAKENMIEQDTENTKSISSLFERSIANLIIDNSEVDPIHGECHEPELGTLKDDMDRSSDVEPMQPNRHETKLGVLEDDETADGKLEHIYGRSHEAESDAPEKDEEFGDDFEPMQSNCHKAAEAGLPKGLKDTDSGSEPMFYETELSALGEDESFGNGGCEQVDSGALGQDDDNGSDIGDIH